MARTTRLLTNIEVLRAKALEKDLTLHNGDGLFLIVKTSGKKLWRFRYQRPATKQRTMMGLGAFPALSLADTRGLRADCLVSQQNCPTNSGLSCRGTAANRPGQYFLNGRRQLVPAQK